MYSRLHTILRSSSAVSEEAFTNDLPLPREPANERTEEDEKRFRRELNNARRADRDERAVRHPKGGKKADKQTDKPDEKPAGKPAGKPEMGKPKAEKSKQGGKKPMKSAQSKAKTQIRRK